MEYLLMHKDLPVLEMELDEATGAIFRIGEIYEPKHIPVGIGAAGSVVDRASLNHWWQGRSIPASRSGIRNALEHLHVSTPQMLLTKCFGLSLSDRYWVKPDDREMRWADINFFDNVFTEDVGNILFGMMPTREEIDLLSPDNTSDGRLKKRWKIIDGTRCLIKGGRPPFHQEPLNEAFSTKLMERLGINHVPYYLIWMDDLPYSVCPDFVTADTELVSAHHILKTLPIGRDESRYRHYLRCCKALGIPDVRHQLDQMLAVGFLLANEDRHTNNFGALRNAGTLEWLGPAPVFECGTSLWHDSIFRWGGPESDGPSKPFANWHSEQIRLVESFDWLKTEALNGAMAELEEILASAPCFIDDDRRAAIRKAFQIRADLLAELAQDALRGTGTDNVNS